MRIKRREPKMQKIKRKTHLQRVIKSRKRKTQIKTSSSSTQFMLPKASTCVIQIFLIYFPMATLKKQKGSLD